MAESIVELRDKLQRARASLSNLRESSQAGIGRGFEAMAGLGGAVVAGGLRAWDPAGPVEVPGTDIPADAAIGAGLAMVGVLGQASNKEETNRMTMVFGLCMLSPHLAQVTGEGVKKYRAK